MLGSKGDPYRVTLTDAKRKCQCIDHRIRCGASQEEIWREGGSNGAKYKYCSGEHKELTQPQARALMRAGGFLFMVAWCTLSFIVITHLVII